MSDAPWRLTALVPLPAEAVGAFVPGMPLDITVPDERTPESARKAVADADLVLGDWSGLLRVDAELLAAAPRLAFIQQPSVGVEAIDLDACAAAGVPVANCAGTNAVSVAEWCVLSALALYRSLVYADGAVRAGGWPQLELIQRSCVELAGHRVGLIGYGAIAAAAARMFAAFDCEVSYWSRRERPLAETQPASYRDLDDLLATSDVVVVVVALADSTRGLLNQERLAKLPRGALVINAARGGIVDEEALIAALDSGHLGGAALDVYPEEPPALDSPVRSHERILLSPHVAGATVQSRLRIATTVAANFRRALQGEPVHHVQNGVDAMVRRRP